MGHQLLLCSSIPHKNYIQTVSTLQALTGVISPQEISTYTLLTKPHNVFKPKFEPGKVNQIEQYYMKCTTIWSDSASEEMDLSNPIVQDGPPVLVDRLFTEKKVNCWTLHISDMPNAGKNPVLAHNYHESTLVHHHTMKNVKNVEVPQTGEKIKSEEPAQPEKQVQPEDSDLMEIDASNGFADVKKEESDQNGSPAKESTPATQDSTQESKQNSSQGASTDAKDSFLQFIEDLGYDVVNQYWLKGIRFFYGDVIIEIFKLFVRDDNSAASDGKLKLSLLDESNTFQIKAYINFPKGASVDLVNQGTKDLNKLKESLKNLFELEVPDRMYMDSRVTRVIS